MHVEPSPVIRRFLWDNRKRFGPHGENDYNAERLDEMVRYCMENIASLVEKDFDLPGIPINETQDDTINELPSALNNTKTAISNDSVTRQNDSETIKIQAQIIQEYKEECQNLRQQLLLLSPKPQGRDEHMQEPPRQERQQGEERQQGKRRLEGERQDLRPAEKRQCRLAEDRRLAEVGQDRRCEEERQLVEERERVRIQIPRHQSNFNVGDLCMVLNGRYAKKTGVVCAVDIETVDVKLHDRRTREAKQFLCSDLQHVSHDLKVGQCGTILSDYDGNAAYTGNDKGGKIHSCAAETVSVPFPDGHAEKNIPLKFVDG